MIKRPDDYDNTTPQINGAFEEIAEGGHVCRILGARVESGRNGNDILALQYDIAEGSPSDGFYQRMYNNLKRKSEDAKWPGTYRVPIVDDQGHTWGMFKGLITCVEDSNPGYRWNWEEKSLVGKLIGFNFGPQEYKRRDGAVSTIIMPRFPASVQAVKDGLPKLSLKKLGRNSAQHVGGVAFGVQPATTPNPFTAAPTAPEEEPELPF